MNDDMSGSPALASQRSDGLGRSERAEERRTPDPADLARWLQEWAEKQPAITIRSGVEPQVAWRALADELLRRWGR